MTRCRFIALQSHNFKSKSILLIILSKLNPQKHKNSKCLLTLILEGIYILAPGLWKTRILFEKTK
jgi:hypothetical protein